jgi:hypothetical protein
MVARRFSGVGVVALERGLGELDVPVAELGPEEAGRWRSRLRVEAVAVDRLAHLGDRRLQAREDVAVGRAEAATNGLERQRRVLAPLHQREARRVPHLVEERAVSGRARDRELHVPAPRRERGEREAQAIGAGRGDALRELLLDALEHGGELLLGHRIRLRLREQIRERDALHHVERIDRVALRLRHLAAVRVPHDRVQEHVGERRLSEEVLAEPDHARDPEEEDVAAGLEDRARVEEAQVLGVVRASRAWRRARDPS